jgi:hypothetical protein
MTARNHRCQDFHIKQSDIAANPPQAPVYRIGCNTAPGKIKKKPGFMRL